MSAFKTSIVLASLALSAQLVSAAATGTAGLPYPVGEVNWHVTAADGTPTNFTGTLEKVLPHIQAINPDYNSVMKEAPIVKRDAGSTSGWDGYNHCTWPPQFGAGDAGAISDGANYLRGFPGSDRLSMSPGSCGQISCSYNSAIWWCTGNNAQQPTNDMGAYAALIGNDCTYGIGRGIRRTKGQFFDRKGYNVIVRDGSC